MSPPSGVTKKTHYARKKPASNACEDFLDKLWIYLLIRISVTQGHPTLFWIRLFNCGLKLYQPIQLEYIIIS